MSQSMAPPTRPSDEQIKNIVHHLYVVKDIQLQGPEGLIELMEEKYGYIKT
jgi:hypothetical protein